MIKAWLLSHKQIIQEAGMRESLDERLPMLAIKSSLTPRLGLRQ